MVDINLCFPVSVRTQPHAAGRLSTSPALSVHHPIPITTTARLLAVRATAVLITCLLLSLCPPLTVAGPNMAEPTAEKGEAPKRFTFADVHRRAAELAATPYVEPDDPLPDSLKNLNYDQYIDIRFRQEKSLWRDQGLPFEAQFFPRGFIHQKKVVINVVEGGEVKPLAYSNELFDYGRNKPPADTLADMGFAGFRLLYPLYRDNYYDELAMFLGASYFRAIGYNQGYGLSGRGLAIDTGLSRPEEFPVFREFWLVKPERDATELTVYALLDSPSVAGAYRFIIKAGRVTVMEVKNSLFMRHGVQKLGVAPLTSMFLFGENTDVRVDDFRPEVHDSDGLLMATGAGEWIWRPLGNPARLRINSYMDNNPRGFGLQQRDREHTRYEDLIALYEKRPSAWVEPIGNWGKGVVQLVEIPSDSQKYDNIVAFWVPEAPTAAGQELSFEYRVYFELDDPNRPPAGKTLASRTGAGGTMDNIDPRIRRFVLDFGGKTLEGLGANAPIEAVVTASAGKVFNILPSHNSVTNGWRVSFELDPEGNSPIELRSFLKANGNVLTETWNYQWEKR